MAASRRVVGLLHSTSINGREMSIPDHEVLSRWPEQSLPLRLIPT